MTFVAYRSIRLSPQSVAEIRFDIYNYCHFACIAGELKLGVDGRSREGELRLGKLSDGRWHRIDIIQTGKVRQNFLTIYASFMVC
jgi:hypothetical protein